MKTTITALLVSVGLLFAASAAQAASPVISDTQATSVSASTAKVKVKPAKRVKHHKVRKAAKAM